MTRYLIGAIAALLLAGGAVMMVQSRAPGADRPSLAAIPDAPPPAAEVDEHGAPLPLIGRAPGVDPKSKEEKRFARADKNKDGRITLAELVDPRRKPFAKLDRDGDGKLSFEEWSVKTIEKFHKANADGDGALSPAEYATTAPKPRKATPRRDCPPPLAAPTEAE